MTERADQLHHDIAPVHSTALVQPLFLAKHHITQIFQPPPLQLTFGSLRLMVFPKAKIAVEREEIFLHATVTQYTNSVNVVSLPTD